MLRSPAYCCGDAAVKWLSDLGVPTEVPIPISIGAGFPTEVPMLIGIGQDSLLMREYCFKNPLLSRTSLVT